MPSASAIDDAVAAWLHGMCTAEKPPSGIVAFNIGLIETADGFSSYLVGARRYDPENSDWACDEDFAPRDRYLALPLRRDESSWEEALQLVAAAVRRFLALEGATTFFASALAVTVGFDDGDLVRVK